MEEQFVDDAQELNYQQGNQLVDIAQEAAVVDHQEEEKIDVMNVAIEAISHVIVVVEAVEEVVVAGHAVAHVHATENIAPAPEATQNHRHQSAQIRAQDVQGVHDIMTHVSQNLRVVIHVAKVQDLNL
jgi:hypothetical protein